MRTTVKYHKILDNGERVTRSLVFDTLTPLALDQAARTVSIHESTREERILVLSTWLTDHPMNEGRE